MPGEISPQTHLILTKTLFQLVQDRSLDLTEELLTNSRAVDILCEALSNSFLHMRSHVKQLLDPVYLEQSGYDPRLLAPKVTASCALDEKEVKNFDATLWFALASDAELRTLRDGGYGKDEVAESVAELAAAYDTEVQDLFDERELLLVNGERGDFTCHVNQEEAEVWLAAHRPSIVLEEMEE